MLKIKFRITDEARAAAALDGNRIPWISEIQCEISPELAAILRPMRPDVDVAGDLIVDVTAGGPTLPKVPADARDALLLIATARDAARQRKEAEKEKEIERAVATVKAWAEAAPTWRSGGYVVCPAYERRQVPEGHEIHQMIAAANERIEAALAADLAEAEAWLALPPLHPPHPERAPYAIRQKARQIDKEHAQAQERAALLRWCREHRPHHAGRCDDDSIPSSEIHCEIRFWLLGHVDAIFRTPRHVGAESTYATSPVDLGQYGEPDRITELTRYSVGLWQLRRDVEALARQLPESARMVVAAVEAKWDMEDDYGHKSMRRADAVKVELVYQPTGTVADLWVGLEELVEVVNQDD